MIPSRDIQGTTPARETRDLAASTSAWISLEAVLNYSNQTSSPFTKFLIGRLPLKAFMNGAYHLPKGEV